MRTRTVRLSEGLPLLNRHHKGFEVTRLRVVGTKDVVFDMVCRTCGRHYRERCTMFSLPKFNYDCSHKETIDNDKAVRSDRCEGWVQAARRIHNTLVAENYKNKDKDFRVFNFNTFILQFFDLCRVRGVDSVDPTSIRISQQSHGLIMENVVFDVDAYKVWPNMRKIALHYKMQGK